MTETERELLLLIAEMAYDTFLDQTVIKCVRNVESTEQAMQEFDKITAPVAKKLMQLGRKLTLENRRPKKRAKTKRVRRKNQRAK